ncbi:hypothetical protein CHF27_012505 [Romboutsia maritimum]|uniref:Uncharacterized protein n=2 Tax=Romboutsia maritimum TaxID=2020948 RepID=A0A371IQ45_9FIRM|nr:hypothetical protein CHF27_012505 [Romboutsia maritimum]
MKSKNLDRELKLKVTCTNGKIIEGTYESYTQALDNEPEIASIGIKTKDINYELYENEIESLEVI